MPPYMGVPLPPGTGDGTGGRGWRNGTGENRYARLMGTTSIRTDPARWKPSMYVGAISVHLT